MARTPRKWQGARNPSGLKRVRQAERRHAILQPRRSAAKTLVAKSVTVATTTPESADVAVALSDAIASLDRAAKAGAIHPNAAARRKSRLVRKVNAAVGGAAVIAGGHAKSTGKAAAAKAAKARIAAGKAVKAKGAQTAAGKARAALSKTTRAETAPAAAVTEAPVAEAPAAKPAAKATTKAAPKTTAKATTTKAAATKSTKAAATKSHHRQGVDRQVDHRQGRAEDHEGEVALVRSRTRRRPGQRPGRFEFPRCPGERPGVAGQWAGCAPGTSAGPRRLVKPYSTPPISEPPSDRTRNEPAVLSWSPQ